MRCSTMLALVLATAVTAGCSEGPTKAVEVAPQAPRFATAIDETPLSVTLSGETEILAAGDYPYTATVSGGTTSSNYYTWYYRWCEKKSDGTIYCEPSYQLKAQGTDLSTITVRIYDWDLRVDLIAQVAESKDGPTTGADSIMVIGPADYDPLAGGDSGFDCNMGSHYPHEEWAWKDGQLVKTGRKYRRNPCYGDKEFDS